MKTAYCLGLLDLPLLLSLVTKIMFCFCFFSVDVDVDDDNVDECCCSRKFLNMTIIS